MHSRDKHDAFRLAPIGALLLAFSGILASKGMYLLATFLLGIGLVGCVGTALELHMRSRTRKKFLALPEVLSSGLVGAHQLNISRLAKALYHRVEFGKSMPAQSILIFDCLLRDTFFENPTLAKEVQAQIIQDAGHYSS